MYKINLTLFGGGMPLTSEESDENFGFLPWTDSHKSAHTQFTCILEGDSASLTPTHELLGVDPRRPVKALWGMAGLENIGAES